LTSDYSKLLTPEDYIKEHNSFWDDDIEDYGDDERLDCEELLV
jgi:hypothetical protein